MNESNNEIRPLLSVAIRPRHNDDRERVEQKLLELIQEDPYMKISHDSTDEQITIFGTGELHLQMICDRILREAGIEIIVGEPKVLYLETIRKQADAECKLIQNVEGREWYAHVKIRLEPREPETGYEFADETKDGAVPLEFVKYVNLGIQQAMKSGIVAGYEVVDLRAVLYDGSYHAEDSNLTAFKTAARMAFKDAARQASAVVLEPVMSVEVLVPEEFVGVVIGDLNSRRGRIETMEHQVDRLTVKALVPLAEMLGYHANLRSNTQGRATFYSRFAAYEAAPHRSTWGDGEAGVVANRPGDPKLQSGSAAAKLDADFEPLN